MEHLLKKLNYKGQERICIINDKNDLVRDIERFKPAIRIDRGIDPKFLYDFFLVFVSLRTDIEQITPATIHNLAEDGVLWFAYPKKRSGKYNSDISRDVGWDLLYKHGFQPVRQVSIDDDWSALRFRNVKFTSSRKRQV